MRDHAYKPSFFERKSACRFEIDRFTWRSVARASPEIPFNRFGLKQFWHMFFIRDPRGSLFRRPARSLSRDGTGTCHVRPRDTSCRPRVSHRLESSVRCRRLTVLSRRGTPRFRARPRASFVFASTDTHLSPRLTEFILARRPTPRSRLSLPGRRQRRRARRLPPRTRASCWTNPHPRMTRKSPMTRSARAIRAANSRRKPKAPLPRFWARTATSPWRWRDRVAKA